MHRLHHRICEHELDYHSPHLADVNHSQVTSFAYAQALWMVWPHPHVKRSPRLEHYHCADLLDDPDMGELIKFVGAHPLFAKGFIGWILPFWVFAAVHIAWRLYRSSPRSASGSTSAEGSTSSAARKAHSLPTSLPSSGMTRSAALAAGGFACAVYYFYLPVALTWFSTGLVNSATHMWGDQPFEDGMIAGCQSKNNAFLMLPMLGENWHNNHHAVPASMSTWVMWYQASARAVSEPLSCLPC